MGCQTAKPLPSSGGKEKQVELSAKFAVIPSFRLFEAMQVLGQSLLVFPGGAVDPLKLGAVLVASPVGSGAPQELHGGQSTG